MEGPLFITVFLAAVLGFLSPPDHPECKLKKRRDRYFVDIIECPQSSDYGTKYVCGTVRGTVSGKWEDVQVQFNTLERDCVQVPVGESHYRDRCVESAMMDGPTQYLLEEAISALGDFEIGDDINFKGTTCYDTHGVPMGTNQVMCPTCSFNELLSVNSLLGPLVDTFNKNNEEACRLENPDDRYHVGYRICSPTYQGEVNKCALVKGEVTAKLLRYHKAYGWRSPSPRPRHHRMRECGGLPHYSDSGGIGGGIDVRYNSVSRGCAQVDMMGRNRDMYRDGCHTRLPFSEPVRKIIVQGYKGASTEMGDITLRGKVCYNNETFSAEKPTKPEGPGKQEGNAGCSQRSLVTSLPVLAALMGFSVYFSYRR